VVFSPDGKWIVSASDDNTARVWESDTGNEVSRITHEYDVKAVAFSPNGEWVISGAVREALPLYQYNDDLMDNTVRVWKADSGQEIARVFHRGLFAGVSTVAFTPDGKWAVSGDENGSLRFWKYRPNDLIDYACEHLYRNLTFKEWKEYMGNAPYEKTCSQLPVHSSVTEEIIGAGRKLMGEGNVEGAIAKYQQALELNPDLDLDPQEEAAWSLVEIGQDLAQEGDPDGAMAKFLQALELDPSLKLVPEEEVAKNLIEGSQDLLKDGEIIGVLKSYEEAQSLDTELVISAKQWNALCWYGSLWNHSTDVMPACERAVELAPEEGWIVDSRGVARALTGDNQGAIEDFQFYIQWAQENDRTEEDIRQREEWIAELEAGRNPFDEELLIELREE
jgi:tetratricopeptide (TPR) repeat protein